MIDKDQRIAELEERVRQLTEIVSCIPMAAAGLSIIPLNQYSRAVRSPLEAMRMLEQISERAERWVALEAYCNAFDRELPNHRMMVNIRRELLTSQAAGALHQVSLS